MNITGVGGCYTHESVPMGRMRKQSYWTRSVLLSKKVVGTIRMKKEMLKNTLRRDAIGGEATIDGRKPCSDRNGPTNGSITTARNCEAGRTTTGTRFCRCGGIHCRSAIDECVDDPGLSEGSSPSSGSQSLFFFVFTTGKNEHTAGAFRFLFGCSRRVPVSS